MTEQEAVTRFKDPPPADMKPDPDYEPQVGEWFWWWDEGMETPRWILRERRTRWVHDSHGTELLKIRYYAGKMLPAEPPE